MSLETPQPEELGYVAHGTNFFELLWTWRHPVCPSCGLYDGVDSHGASDPRRNGGAEHVCWRCADSLNRANRFDNIMRTYRKDERLTREQLREIYRSYLHGASFIRTPAKPLVTVYHQNGNASPLLVPSDRVSEFAAEGWFPAEALDDDGESTISTLEANS